MKKIPTEIIDNFLDKDDFLILMHQKPDGDAIGSAIGLGKALKSLGKNVDYYVDIPIEEKLLIFPEIDKFNQLIKQSYDTIVFLDCSNYDFAFKPEEFPKFQTTIVIDHHKSNTFYGDLNMVEITSATAEIVFRIIKAMDVLCDKEMAEAIFTGISTDTGSFQFSNVTADTHRILSELLTIHPDFSSLSKRLHHYRSFCQMKMTGEAIHSLEILEDTPIAIMFLDNETINKCGGTLNISDDVANIGQNVIGVVMTVLIKEVSKGNYKVSIRAKSPYDVHEIAVSYGGGGHERAAGFSYSGELSSLKIELLNFYRKKRKTNE
jgi:phosphoesterase RecJ-like protein